MKEIVAYIKGKLKSNFEEKLVKGNDLVGLEKDIKRLTESITKETLKEFLEDYDERIKLDSNRDSRYVVQREVKKTITSTLGTFDLLRTKYYDKVDGKYLCLLDERLNMPKYERFTVLANAKLLEEATNTCYSRAGKAINSSDEFSKGMVYSKIKKLNVEETYKEKDNKKKARALYINLDEDHIALQKSNERRTIGKIGYIYEGNRKVCKGRNRLVNKHTICGTYPKSSGNKAFYERINEYISCNYDMDYLEKIIVYGDGAAWITACTNYIPKSEFRIDRFHLSKYLLTASYTIPGNRLKLKQNAFKCIYDEDKEKFINLMDDAKEMSTNKDKVIEARDYVINNWDAINKTMFSTDGSGCSAEGNVSHTLSARMSQKGLGWCKHNADQMCRLRGMQVNGGSEVFIEISNECYYNRINLPSKSKQNGYMKYIVTKNRDNDDRYIERMQASVPIQLSKKIEILGTKLHLN